MSCGGDSNSPVTRPLAGKYDGPPINRNEGDGDCIAKIKTIESGNYPDEYSAYLYCANKFVEFRLPCYENKTEAELCLEKAIRFASNL